MILPPIMVSDIITSLTTTISPAHKALGYLTEALDMRRRSRINREAWQPHLENSRRVVLSAAQNCAQKGRVVILGSGLLLDVPLSGLAGMFREVVLKDVVCLPEVRKRIAAYTNVSFHEQDVTSLAEPLYRHWKQGLLRLPEIAQPAPEHETADLVVSLNILSQLWVVPRTFISRSMRQLDPLQVDEWCSGVVDAHYAWLRSLPCNVCLIADHEYVRRDRTGSIVTRGSTLHGCTLPQPDDEWTWSIAPLGKDDPHASKELVVGGWNLLHA